jgi:acetolactate synthase-1/3 small subunit
MEPRHVLSLLVDNHAGVLARISGFFSRRRFNIDSLTVSATHDPGLSRMTVALCGDEEHLSQVMRQLEKVVDVQDVTRLCEEGAILRELLLIKISVDGRTEHYRKEVKSSIMQALRIYGGKIVDWSDEVITLELTSDSNSVDAFINILKTHEIVDMARTGLTALERGHPHHHKREGHPRPQLHFIEGGTHDNCLL